MDHFKSQEKELHNKNIQKQFNSSSNNGGNKDHAQQINYEKKGLIVVVKITWQ